MSHPYVCDACHKKEQEHRIVGWIELAPIGHQLEMLRQPQVFGKSFCSVTCLHQWASAYIRGEGEVI